MRKTQAQAEPKKAAGLPWEYCECGCKGYAVTVGGYHLWMYNDLGERCNSYQLHRGHGLTSPVVSFHASFEAADRVARELLKPEFERVKAFVQTHEHLFV